MPLADKERAAHKLGLLNEVKVHGVVGALIKGAGWELLKVGNVDSCATRHILCLELHLMAG